VRVNTTERPVVAFGSIPATHYRVYRVRRNRAPCGMPEGLRCGEIAPQLQQMRRAFLRPREKGVWAGVTPHRISPTAVTNGRVWYFDVQAYVKPPARDPWSILVERYV
jgi:hypothetical protein